MGSFPSFRHVSFSNCFRSFSETSPILPPFSSSSQCALTLRWYVAVCAAWCACNRTKHDVSLIARTEIKRNSNCKRK